MTEHSQDPEELTPPLASSVLRGEIVEVGKLADAVRQQPAPAVTTRRRVPILPLFVLSAIGFVAATLNALEARRVPLNWDSVRRGLELQAVRVRADIIRTGKMPSSLDQVGRLDPSYRLVPMGDYRFRIELVAGVDTFAVQSSVDAREYIWLPPRLDEVQP